MRIKRYGTLKSLPRTGRMRKTTSRIDRKIVAFAENSEQPSARDIAKQLAELSLVDLNPRTVQNR